MAARKKPSVVVRRGERRSGIVRPGVVRPGVITAGAVPGPVAPDERRRGEQLVNDVLRLRTEIAAGFYQMGLALRELAEPSVYRALGFASFGELLEKRGITSRMTANKLIAVAASFPEPVAKRLGVEKSYAFLRYAKRARPRADVVALVQRDPVIPGTRARLSAISLRDLQLATRVIGDPDPALSQPDAAVRRAVRALGRLLRRAGIDTSKVRSRRRGRQWTVRIELDAAEAQELVNLVEPG